MKYTHVHTKKERALEKSEQLQNKVFHVSDLVDQGCQNHFHQGHISLAVVFKGLNVILGLHECNSLLFN